MVARGRNPQLPRPIQNAACYDRLSREDEQKLVAGEDVWSNHERILKPLMARHGHEGLVIEREVYTGDSLRERKVFSDLLKRIDEGRVDALFLLDIDRLGRGRMSEAGYVLDVLLRHEVLLVTPERVYDPVRDETDLEMLELRMFMARAELRAIKKRLYRARTVRAAQGYYTGGSAPYGYDLVKKRLVPKPGEIEWRVFAWHLRAAGWPRNRIMVMFDGAAPFPSRLEVQAALEALGLPTSGLPDLPAAHPPASRRSAHWRAIKTIQGWFTSRLDEGYITFSGEHYPAPHGAQVPPAIVEAARTFEAARGPRGRVRDNEWLLQVWYMDHDPPLRMYGQKKHGYNRAGVYTHTARYYFTDPKAACFHPSIRADPLEETAVQYLFALRDDEKLTKRLQQAIEKRNAAPDQAARRKSLQRRLQQSEAALSDTLNRLKSPGLATVVRDGYEHNLEELAQDAAAIRREMASLDAGAAEAARAKDHLAAARNLLRQLTPAWWDSLSYRDKKRLLQTLIPRVEVRKEGTDWVATFYTSFGSPDEGAVASAYNVQSVTADLTLQANVIPLGECTFTAKQH